MSDLWLPGFEIHQFEGLPGGSYDRTTDKKVLLHTTEGTSIESAMRAYSAYPPHVVVDYATRSKVQHIPLNLCSYSLKRGESDDEPVIQVEIVGFAAQSHGWPTAMLEWLAVEVLAPIHRLWPFELQAPPSGFAGEHDGIYPYLATAESPIRFGHTEFTTWSGVCGHQHAPSPDNHWDPGKLDIDTVLRYLARELAPKSVTSGVQLPTEGQSSLEVRVLELETKFKILASTMHLADSPYDFVAALYRLVLKREPDDEGLLHWTDQLAHGKATPLVIIDAFLDALKVEAATKQET